MAGEDVTDTIVSVISKEPDWPALPPSTPAPVRSLRRRCLDRDPKRRLRDIGETRLALDGAFETTAPQTPADTSSAPRERLAWMVAAAAVLEEDLSNRVLDFDQAAAASAAQIAAGRQRSGRVADLRDTLIAGIALARRATIATRRTRHFAGLDVPVVDPWKA